MSLLADMAAIVGSSGATNDPDVLERYSSDHSFQRGSPSCVAYAENAEQIQEIVKYAGRERVPVTARSSGVGFNGAGIPDQGGIVLDLSRMNKIITVDPSNKYVKVEAGVTFAQLQSRLKEEGMQVCMPLAPHATKSAISSSLEREPITIAKPEYNDTLLTFGIVLANGELLRTGSSLGTGMSAGIAPDGVYPGSQLYKMAQGTMGIVAWGNLKTEWLPTIDKVYFIPLARIEDVPAPVYGILRREIGREIVVLNDHSMASLLADKGGFASLKGALPPYTVAVNIAGPERMPERKIAYEEEVLFEVAARCGCKPSTSIAGSSALGAKLIERLRQAWPADEDYWKTRDKGGTHDVFFYTTLDRVPSFKSIIDDTAADFGYPLKDIGCYIQPLEVGRICHCQFSFACDDSDKSQVAMVKPLFLEASKRVFKAGAFFANPYGPWADMVYHRAGDTVGTLRQIRKAYDPNNILNPGKLCF